MLSLNEKLNEKKIKIKKENCRVGNPGTPV